MLERNQSELCGVYYNNEWLVVSENDTRFLLVVNLNTLKCGFSWLTVSSKV